MRVALLLSTMEKKMRIKLYTFSKFVCAFTLLVSVQVQAREHVRDIEKPVYPHSLTAQLTTQLVPFKPYVHGYIYNTFDALSVSLAETYLYHQGMRNDTHVFFTTLRSHWARLFRDVVRSEFRNFFTTTFLGVSTRRSSSSSSALKFTDKNFLTQPLLFQLKPKVKIDLSSGNFKVGFEKELQHGFIGQASFDTEHSTFQGSLKKQISDDFYFRLKTSSEFSDKKNKDLEIGFNFNF